MAESSEVNWEMRDIHVRIKYRTGNTPPDTVTLKAKVNETYRKLKRHICESFDTPGRLMFNGNSPNTQISENEDEIFELITEKKLRNLNKHKIQLRVFKTTTSAVEVIEKKIARTTTFANLKHKMQDKLGIPKEMLSIYTFGQRAEYPPNITIMQLPQHKSHPIILDVKEMEWSKKPTTKKLSPRHRPHKSKACPNPYSCKSILPKATKIVKNEEHSHVDSQRHTPQPQYLRLGTPTSIEEVYKPRSSPKPHSRQSLRSVSGIKSSQGYSKKSTTEQEIHHRTQQYIQEKSSQDRHYPNSKSSIQATTGKKLCAIDEARPNSRTELCTPLSHIKVKPMGEHESYHGRITGEEAEKKLMEAGGNRYLTRYSSRYESYVLTIWNQQKQLIRHYKIVTGDNEQCQIEGTGKCFTKITHLLVYYQENRIDPDLNTIGRCLPVKSLELSNSATKMEQHQESLEDKIHLQLESFEQIFDVLTDAMKNENTKAQAYFMHAMKIWSSLTEKQGYSLWNEFNMYTDEDTFFLDYLHFPWEFTERYKDKLKDRDSYIASIIESIKEGDWMILESILQNLTLISTTQTYADKFDELDGSVLAVSSFNLSLYDLTNMFSRSKKQKVLSTKVDGLLNVFFNILHTSDITDDFSKSKAMLISTHRNQISDSDFMEIKRLCKCIELLETDDEVLLDSTQLGVLANKLKDNMRDIKIPVSWLILSICIRNLNMSIMSLAECEKIAEELNIGPKELQEALWFLHHSLGFLLYYPEVKELKETIFCDIQTVLAIFYKLITSIDKANYGKFKGKALFVLDDLDDEFWDEADHFVLAKKLIKLMEYRDVLTLLPFKLERVTKIPYFMPCVLKIAEPADLTLTNSESGPAPLLLYYNCGYVPVGVFSAMITNLVSQQTQLKLMIENKLHKNKLKFVIEGDYDIVTYKLFPSCIAIEIERQRKFDTSTTDLCYTILHNTESALNSILERRTYNVGYNLGFICPAHPSEDHVCILADKTAKRMECLQDPSQRRLSTIPLHKRHSYWFTSFNSGPTAEDKKGTPTLINLLNFHTATGKVNIAEEIGVKYNHFGVALLKDEVGNLIEAFEKQYSKPSDINREIFREWLQGRGRDRNWATLIDILMDVGLKTLARTIEENLHRCQESE